MTIKFNRKKRFDAARAEEGIWIDAESGDEVFGSFKVRYTDGTLTSVDLEMKRIRASRCAALKVKKLSEIEAFRAVIADYSLLDWKGIEDEDGNAVPFSSENAWEYFSDEATTWVLLNLISEASDPANFKSVDPVKNS